MKVRQTDVTQADKQSAVVFFDALLKFFDMKDADVLDAFARNGQLTVSQYHARVKSVECWELGPEHKAALQQYTLNVKIGDSYGIAQKTSNEYDLIVIDTPQGLHKDDTGAVKCEHFDFLPVAVSKLRPGGILVLYVNKHPYDKNEVGSQGYDEYEEYNFGAWMAMRQEYYGSHTAPLGEEQALDVYRDEIRQMGRQVGRVMLIPCFSDVPGKAPYAFRVALEVL